MFENKIISPLDFHFAKFIEDLSGGPNPALALAAALASHDTKKGNACLDLSALAGRAFPDEKADGRIICPDLSAWLQKLKASPVVGKPGDNAPLLLHKTRLYLQKYYLYEKVVAEAVLERVSIDEKVDAGLLKNGLDRLFPDSGDGEADRQRTAASSSVLHKFCAITGGPGTGKTSTVVKILALLLEQAGDSALRIALAAPTGKAAARLQGAVAKAGAMLDCPGPIKERIPVKASTIHRLLGPVPHSRYFRHGPGNRLPLDLVVVDEASMVDLPLMAKLVRALEPGCRLILLGDSHQLASVEPGAVLGDICSGETDAGPLEPDTSSGLRGCVVRLRKNYRMESGSGMERLSLAIKEGNDGEALDILKSGLYPDASWRELPEPKNLSWSLNQTITGNFKACLETSDPLEALERFEKFRILCALREGPFGVIALNRIAEEALSNAGLIDPEREWYSGRPVMITRNDYELDLFNGDMGIILPERQGDSRLFAFFAGPDGEARKFFPQLLPQHETVFAITAHKSQGSEFERALLILPDSPSPVLTRELVYTGITRARKGVEIMGREEVFSRAARTRMERTSGLREALWGEE
ncbi:MAG: exodeoxyribonuclease V subunit alpha [Nitrospinae bacterium]|nr:exodeoxyribonuclease V subunit alpha [Nitrospinota bacterium]